MPTESPEPPWRAALTANPIHDPPRVLVAEDDEEMRRLVVEALRKDGYEVISVSDGGRLLVTLAHEFVEGEGAGLADIVVSDLRMPVCTGMRSEERRVGKECW